MPCIRISLLLSQSLCTNGSSLDLHDPFERRQDQHYQPHSPEEEAETQTHLCRGQLASLSREGLNLMTSKSLSTSKMV